MATKYIVNNVSGQTIIGGLSISGKTTVLTEPPTSVIGSEGDKLGDLAFDSDYLYYCSNDYVAAQQFIISGGTPSHVFDADPNSEWNTYGGNFLQTGAPQEEGLVPLAGWYIVDDNGTIRQVLSDPAWFTGGAPTPIQNGPGWFFVLDGPFSYSVSNPTLTFYETLPNVTNGNTGSGNIWKTIKFDKTLNTTGIYKALLTQTTQINGTSIDNFNGGLIIGETYTIVNYSNGDDFSNIANVISGTINEANCEFIATGDTPAVWINFSTLISSGNLVVDVLENSLGFDLEWSMNPFGGQGTYVASNQVFGPIYNTFKKNKTTITSELTISNFPSMKQIFCSTGNVSAKDDSVFLLVWDFDKADGVDNNLYYTPIEITIKQDLDTTPVVINGSVQSSYPFNYASVDLICNGNYVEAFIGDNTTVNNLAELIAQLNTNIKTSYLGTYSDDGLGGIILTIPANKANQFCSNGTLTFEVFAD